METAIIGQQHVIQRLLLTLLCNGNCLLEGLPGLAKTRAVKSLAQHLEAELKRVQFTPDLLPADITGSEIYLGENAQLTSRTPVCGAQAHFSDGILASKKP